MNTIAASIDEEADTIEEVYEPYLMQLGFIDRTPRGRVGTDRAFEYFKLPRRRVARVAERSVLKTAFLALGSNLGDREANLRDAVQRLEAAEITILRASSLYETAPQELLDQPSFLNAVL